MSFFITLTSVNFGPLPFLFPQLGSKLTFFNEVELTKVSSFGPTLGE